MTTEIPKLLNRWKEKKTKCTAAPVPFCRDFLFRPLEEDDDNTLMRATFKKNRPPAQSAMTQGSRRVPCYWWTLRQGGGWHLIVFILFQSMEWLMKMNCLLQLLILSTLLSSSKVHFFYNCTRIAFKNKSLVWKSWFYYKSLSFFFNRKITIWISYFKFRLRTFQWLSINYVTISILTIAVTRYHYFTKSTSV